MNIFQAQAQIQSVQTLTDGSIKLSVVTQELRPEDLTQLFRLRGKLGWFLMKETEIKSEEIPTEEITLEGRYKTPSQELRSVLFIYWREKTDQSTDFDTVWYPSQMRKFKDKVLEGMN